MTTGTANPSRLEASSLFQIRARQARTPRSSVCPSISRSRFRQNKTTPSDSAPFLFPISIQFCRILTTFAQFRSISRAIASNGLNFDKVNSRSRDGHGRWWRETSDETGSEVRSLGRIGGPRGFLTLSFLL